MEAPSELLGQIKYCFKCTVCRQTRTTSPSCQGRPFSLAVLSAMMTFSGLFIIICFAFFVLYVAVESVRVRRGEKRKFEVRFWGFVLVFALFLVLRIRINAHLGPTLWRQTFATNVLADVATLFGFIVAIWSRRALGRSWSSEVIVQKEHELIQRGPYALIRHPMYSGLLLMLLGVAIYYGRYPWILIFVCCLFGLYTKSQLEEKLLAKTFPDYENYKRRTKALIPWVW